MGRIGADPKDWLPEMRQIVSAIAKALNGREPSLALIVATRQEYADCIPGHLVHIEWFPTGYSDDPLERPEYVIRLSGDRLKANWLILEADFYRVLRTPDACAQGNS